MAVKLANGVTIPTATDRFNYAKQIKQLGLVAGIVPKVKTRAELDTMVKALKTDPLFQGDFAWLVYVTSENKLYLHDGTGKTTPYLDGYCDAQRYVGQLSAASGFGIFEQSLYKTNGLASLSLKCRAAQNLSQRTEYKVATLPTGFRPAEKIAYGMALFSEASHYAWINTAGDLMIETTASAVKDQSIFFTFPAWNAA